jgi:hypothetical protein
MLIISDSLVLLGPERKIHMKAHHWILILAISAAVNTAFAQAPATKPPIGVPADAKPFNGKWYRVYLS